MISKVYGREICVFDSCGTRIFNGFYTSVASGSASELHSLSGIFAMSRAIFRDFHNGKIGTCSAFFLSPVFHHFIRGQLTSLNPGEL